MPRLTLDDPRLQAVFGSEYDAIETVAERAALAFYGVDAIVWEGDAQTFAFSYVSDSAHELLGHPVRDWLGGASFWAETVVDPRDRDDAIAYCALATGRCRDHAFEYRARTKDGKTVWLRDFVKVLVSRKGVPERLRGIMFDVTAEKRFTGTFDDKPFGECPSRDELRRAG